MYSIISPIKKDINVPIETNKLSLSPNDSMKIENVNVKLLYILILSILVDTFISKISFPMQPGPEIGSISDA